MMIWAIAAPSPPPAVAAPVTGPTVRFCPIIYSFEKLVRVRFQAEWFGSQWANNTISDRALVLAAHVAFLPLDHTVSGLLIPGFGDRDFGSAPLIQLHLKLVHPSVMLISEFPPMLVVHQRVRANLLPLIQAHQMTDTIL